jgi:hypothetical protein
MPASEFLAWAEAEEEANSIIFAAACREQERDVVIIYREDF